MAALWQRWFPDKPSFEALDDKMQAGYELRASGGAVAACHTRWEAWRDVLHILDKSGISQSRSLMSGSKGLNRYLTGFRIRKAIYGNAGLEDRQFLTARIALCEEALQSCQGRPELIYETGLVYGFPQNGGN